MPSYKVIEPGFFDGAMYAPSGRRKTLTVDKPFTKENKPSWVAPLDEQKVERSSPAKKPPKAIKKAKQKDGDVEVL